MGNIRGPELWQHAMEFQVLRGNREGVTEQQDWGFLGVTATDMCNLSSIT